MSPVRNLSFLAGGGEMGALIRAFDWGSTPIGPPDVWPQGLRTALRLLLNADDPMLVWWGPDLIQFYNDAYRHALGPERHPDGLGQSGRVCWTEGWDVVGPRIEAVMHGGQTLRHDDQPASLIGVGALAEPRWAYCYNPIDEGDGVGGVLVICHDVTQLHLATQALQQTQERLQESRERLRRLNSARHAPVPEQEGEQDPPWRLWSLSRNLLAVATADQMITSVNPAWTARLGWGPEDVVGRSLREFTHPENAQDSGALNGGEPSAGGEPVLEAVRVLHADGTYRWISWSSVAEGDTLYAVGRDVTREHEALQALWRTEEALRQSQKMEAVGQLTGGIAHDFNNMLQGIIGALDLLGKRVSAGRLADVDRLLTAATASAERAADLTHRLLAFSRRQPLDPHPVEMNPLVAAMADILARTLGEGVEVELSLTPESWPALCDRNQLESAILNLAINARDAMPEGGVLRIHTGNTQLTEDGDNPVGDFVCVSISDNGSGMSPEVLDRVFEPFFTTKPQGRGTGLGLSMVYGFIRQSGGRIDIDSREGVGTKVRLCLPRHTGPIETAKPVLVGRSREAADGEVVLVVEDDAVVRDEIVEELVELGYRVLQADDGPEGLETLQSNGRIDLLVTDVGLPGLNGRQMARVARQTRRDLKILFITGYAQDAVDGDLNLEWGMELLTKPFPMKALTERVGAMIDSRRVSA
jgi:PAS domain S-box-containing protein